MTGQAMNEHATPAFWHDELVGVPLPHTRRGTGSGSVLFDSPCWRSSAFAVTTPGFFTAVSLFSLFNTTSFIGCVAVGMTFITLSGNIMSFSLGVTLSTSGIVFIAALPLGLIGALITPSRSALAHGDLRVSSSDYFRANPIIVSMAALALITGCATLITQGRGVYPEGDVAAALKGRIFGVPMPLAGFIVTVVVAQIVLSFTRFGRQLYMVGSNWRGFGGRRVWRLPGSCSAPTSPRVCVRRSPAYSMAARYSSGDLELGTRLRLQRDQRRARGWHRDFGGEGSARPQHGRRLHHQRSARCCCCCTGSRTQARVSGDRRHRAGRDYAADARRRSLTEKCAIFRQPLRSPVSAAGVDHGGAVDC